MKIILAAIDEPLALAWEEHCGDFADISVHRGSITGLKCDAVVSPANSFGFMDGGIDELYSHHFGWHLQDRLQALIREKHRGELLVGHADIIDTDDVRIPFLIAAPTMRVPMILRDSVNPYLASRAVLLLIRDGVFSHGLLQGERIADAVKTVAFPGLGTGVGRIAVGACARQVRAALDEVLLGRSRFPKSWADASEQHQRLYANRTRDLQLDDDA